MTNKEIDERAKELFDSLNVTKRRDIAYTIIRSAIADVSKGTCRHCKQKKERS